MSPRTRRMQRLTDLAHKSERVSRRELVRATQDSDAAEAALQSVFLQCREVVEHGDQFSVRFGRGLIEAGWLTAAHRRNERDTAVERVEERRRAWQDQRTRLDALGRLVDRLVEEDAAHRDRTAEAALGDVINARIVANGHTDHGMEVPA